MIPRIGLVNIHQHTVTNFSCVKSYSQQLSNTQYSIINYSHQGKDT